MSKMMTDRGAGRNPGMGERDAAVEHLKLHIPRVGETFAKLEGTE